MDFIYPIVMAGTIFLILAFMYFYILYRERYIGLWLISWLIFFGRVVLFDYGPLDWKQSTAVFIFFQSLVIANSLTFIWGTYIFISKPLKKYWLYSAAAAFALSTAACLRHWPLLYKMLPSLLLAGFTCIWIGKIFIRQVKIKGIGNYITGYALVAWGVLTLYMPYSINIPPLSSWCYLAAGVDRLIITLGILIVYFEKTRADLAQKEALYRLLAENAADVIYRYRLRPETNFEYISPSALAVTGYTPEEYYFAPGLLSNIIHPDDARQFEDFIGNPALPADLPQTFRLTHKNGATIWIEPKIVDIRDKDGCLTAVEGIIRDVTVRKKMEQIISRAEKLNTVGQMALSVAHEIRNPLTSIRGFLQMVAVKKEGKICPERCELMISELDRANAIITEYLLLAKDKVPDLKNRCLNSIIHALSPLLQAAAGASGTIIKFELENIPELPLDENEMRQLLFNLFNNSLEAMPAGGELRIRTYLEQNNIVLSLSDQGPGISPYILENLGTPFLTTKEYGTGLGLAVCYRIAHRHSAAIRVETGAHGTNFMVKFGLPAATT